MNARKSSLPTTQPGFDRFATRRRFCWLMAGVAGWVCLSGCRTTILDQVIGPSYQPRNVYRPTHFFPIDFRRVAVLPLVTDGDDSALESGREALQPVLYAELEKARTFEVMPVTREQLRQITGQATWRAEEKLPESFFKQLRAALSCDAVLFCRLSQYRPYPPLAIGWNLKLVDCPEVKIRWSIDEVFDAGDATVVNAARRYFQKYGMEERPLVDSQGVLSSPRRFGQYSANAVFATLPQR